MNFLKSLIYSVVLLGFSSVGLAETFNAVAYRKEVQSFSFFQMTVQMSLQFGYTVKECGSAAAHFIVTEAEKNPEWEDVKGRVKKSLDNPKDPECFSSTPAPLKLSVLANELGKRSAQALEAFKQEMDKGAEK